MDQIKLTQPLFLCGMMGAGKTTVGKIVAEKTTTDFRDLDDLIEDHAGLSIPDIFDRHGEDYFRDLEQKILIKTSQQMSGVMALGGGALQNQRVVDHLKIYGWLIFLNVPKSVIFDRLAGDENRPMLSHGHTSREQLRNTINTLMNERLPFYNQAQITIDADRKTPVEVAEKILTRLTIYEGFNRR